MNARPIPPLILAGLLLAGCATPDHGRPGGFRGRPPPGGMDGLRQRLFISPSGEPFRSEPGEPAPIEAWFAQADRDHDGALTRDEFRADADAFFQKIDTNGDGVIDMDESAAYETKVAPEIVGGGRGGEMAGPAGGVPRGGGMRGGGRGRGGPHGGGGRGDVRGADFDAMLTGAARFGLLNEAQPIRIADANYSMSVDRAEWRAASDRRFRQLDKDGDGVLHLAELRRVPDMKASGGGHRRRPGGEP
jgi:hypothetical protein